MLGPVALSHPRAQTRTLPANVCDAGRNVVVAIAWLLALALPSAAAFEGLANNAPPHPLLSHVNAVAGDGDATRTVRIPFPVIRAAGALEWRGKPFRMTGVAITDPDATCGVGVSAWPCGRMALTAIRRFVRTRTIVCAPLLDSDPDDPSAKCTIGERDVADWLVTHGWAKATGTAYAKAEADAKAAERGLWSPVRPDLTVVAAGSGQAVISGDPDEARVLIEVNLSRQELTLAHRGSVVASWPVSTARAGKRTPVGRFRAQWLSRHHRSSLYNNAPMPYSVFFNGDYAIHGTNEIGRLGRPASAGCVRLHPSHAAIVFDLTQREGPQNTLVVIRR